MFFLHSAPGPRRSGQVLWAGALALALAGCEGRALMSSDSGNEGEPGVDLSPGQDLPLVGRADSSAAGGVSVVTDRGTYEASDAVKITLVNGTDSSIFVTGCTPFRMERNEGGAWVDRGLLLACKWEGEARLLASKGTELATFSTSAGGTWRVAVDYGTGCAKGKPLSQSQCASKSVARSAPFSVKPPVKLCLDLVQEYSAAMPLARTCSDVATPQCTTKVTAYLGCGCYTYVNLAQELLALEKKFNDAGCKVHGGYACPPSPCKQVDGSTCVKGTCQDLVR